MKPEEIQAAIEAHVLASNEALISKMIASVSEKFAESSAAQKEETAALREALQAANTKIEALQATLSDLHAQAINADEVMEEGAGDGQSALFSPAALFGGATFDDTGV